MQKGMAGVSIESGNCALRAGDGSGFAYLLRSGSNARLSQSNELEPSSDHSFCIHIIIALIITRVEWLRVELKRGRYRAQKSGASSVSNLAAHLLRDPMRYSTIVSPGKEMGRRC